MVIQLNLMRIQTPNLPNPKGADMFNKVIIVGNLTRDVELKYLPSGSAVARIGLASGRKYKKQDGDMVDETCFIDASLFGRTAEIANQYLKKGSQVLIEGRLRYETWTDANGQKRSKHTVTAESMQMLGRANQSGDSSGYGGGYNNSQGESYAQNSGNSGGYSESSGNKNVPEIDIDDEIPF